MVKDEDGLDRTSRHWLRNSAHIMKKKAHTQRQQQKRKTSVKLNKQTQTNNHSDRCVGSAKKRAKRNAFHVHTCRPRETPRKLVPQHRQKGDDQERESVRKQEHGRSEHNTQKKWESSACAQEGEGRNRTDTGNRPRVGDTFARNGLFAPLFLFLLLCFLFFLRKEKTPHCAVTCPRAPSKSPNWAISFGVFGDCKLSLPSPDGDLSVSTHHAHAHEHEPACRNSRVPE